MGRPDLLPGGMLIIVLSALLESSVEIAVVP